MNELKEALIELRFKVIESQALAEKAKEKLQKVVNDPYLFSMLGLSKKVAQYDRR